MSLTTPVAQLSPRRGLEAGVGVLAARPPLCPGGALAAFFVPPDGVLQGLVLCGSGGCCPASPLHPKPASGSGSLPAFPWPLLLTSTAPQPRALAAALMCDMGGGLLFCLKK